MGGARFVQGLRSSLGRCARGHDIVYQHNMLALQGGRVLLSGESVAHIAQPLGQRQAVLCRRVARALQPVMAHNGMTFL